jgi:prolyl-tRNA synthetase
VTLALLKHFIFSQRLDSSDRCKKTATDCFASQSDLLPQSSSGIYTLLPAGQRVVDKIERIINEEMERMGEFFLAFLSWNSETQGS